MEFDKLEGNAIELLRERIGEELMILGKHPFAGRTGILKSIDFIKGVGKTGLLVEIHKYCTCYVFDSDQIKFINIK